MPDCHPVSDDPSHLQLNAERLFLIIQILIERLVFIVPLFDFDNAERMGVTFGERGLRSFQDYLTEDTIYHLIDWNKIGLSNKLRAENPPKLIE